MARLRKNETSVNTAPAASSAPATARRTTAALRKRVAAKSMAGESVEPVEETSAVAASIPETAFIKYEPSHEEISALAYSYWVDRGYAEGCPEQDWLRAETELRRRVRAAE